jgi:hypothetical protein
MSVRAWQLLAGLPAWEITEIPRPAPPGGEAANRAMHRDLGERERRVLSLASASRAGSAAAFGWVRELAGGPVRVIAAGNGLRAEDDGAAGQPGQAILLGYPAGALGRPLPPGGLPAAFTALPCWVPVAITADMLLGQDHGVPGGDGPSPEDGLLRAWRGPLGWLVLAAPIGKSRHAELLSQVSLAQLMAQRHDTPRAQLAARRTKTRHDELREAATTGLWEIWLLAGAATPAAATRVAGLLAASLDLRGLPFGLTEKAETGPLPRLLGAPPESGPAAGPGPLTRDVLAMYHDDGAPGRFAAPPPGPLGLPPQSGPLGGYPERGAALAAADQMMPPGPGSQRPEWPGGAQPAAPHGAGQTADFPDPEPEFPCAGSSRLLAALAVPPAREVPGIRMVLQPGFDVTPETTASHGDGIRLGTVLDATRSPAGALPVPRESLNRHVFVCGATGSGKSQTVRHLLESAARAGIPWLVIEPAKAEYRLMAARLPRAEVTAIRPGDLDAVPAGINPLEPASGPDGTRFPLQAHADLVRALFMAAFQADEPFPQVLSAALTRCYTEAGWDLVTGEPLADDAAYPTLGDLQAAALAVVEQIGYSREITDNVRGFVSVRIGSLRGGTTGRFLEGAFPLDYAKLLDSNVVLEIEDCGDDTDKAFLTGAVLIRLTEHLRMRARAEGPQPPALRHLTVVEEAHRLLRQPPPGEGGGPAAHAVEMFAGLLAEIRAYGEGLVIAEQIPSKLIPDVIKNTAVKVVHRLPAKDDRDTVGATMNLTDDQSRYLVTLVPGEAAVFADGMDYPVLARMPDGTGRETRGTGHPVKTASALVATRSPTCSADCGTTPCTLGQIAAAQRAAARDPRITLWAELAVLAHLTGWPVPGPKQDFADMLNGLDGRVRDCALGHAAEGAARSRGPAILPRVEPLALAAHVAAVLRDRLADDQRCPREEPQWLAPACEWDGVAEALSRGVSDHAAGRHPRSAEWESAHGRPIPGADCAAQLAVVTAWHEQAWERDSRRRALTIFGGGNPSAVERAAGTRVSAPDWPERIADALDNTVTGYEWALLYLVPLPQEDEAR